MNFVTIQGHVIRTDHVSVVGPISKSAGSDNGGNFAVYILGAGADQPLFIWAKGKQLAAARNKLLRAMGAAI